MTLVCRMVMYLIGVIPSFASVSSQGCIVHLGQQAEVFHDEEDVTLRGSGSHIGVAIERPL